MMRIGLVCEPTPGDDEVQMDQAVGCLLGFLFGSSSRLTWAATSHLAKTESPDFSVVVPLPVCDACRPTLADPAALRQALRHIPEYTALLDQYPKAEVKLVS
jgi:hypothetical protein